MIIFILGQHMFRSNTYFLIRYMRFYLVYKAEAIFFFLWLRTPYKKIKIKVLIESDIVG